AEDDVE
nr:Chain D, MITOCHONDRIAL IMPORT RECEPTOR SUBUNIT TOM20 HOMOLOG [Homo sapiens]4APO_E Chain E, MITOCHONDRIAL IMPORT RECEPTOR SUBUNIT TOM20 HOMOLOG [Homo sapiens]